MLSYVERRVWDCHWLQGFDSWRSLSLRRFGRFWRRLEGWSFVCRLFEGCIVVVLVPCWCSVFRPSSWQNPRHLWPRLLCLFPPMDLLGFFFGHARRSSSADLAIIISNRNTALAQWQNGSAARIRHPSSRGNGPD